MLFTPLTPSGERIKMDIMDKDINQEEIVSFYVTDNKTGKIHQCETARGGCLGRVCDAKILCPPEYSLHTCEKNKCKNKTEGNNAYCRKCIYEMEGK
jgi:hypothetical protein